MAIHLSVRHAPTHVRFEMSGERTPGRMLEEQLALWGRVAEECRAAGVDCALVVTRMREALPAADGFRLASSLPAILVGAVRRLAVAVLGGEAVVRASLFTENVAVRRGVESRVFDDEARALEWLLLR